MSSLFYIFVFSKPQKDISCLVDCGYTAELLAVHCVCNTGAMFDEDTKNRLDITGSVFCNGDDDCRSAVLDLTVAVASSSSSVAISSDDLLSGLVDHCVPTEFSFSYGYECMANCPMEVLEVVGQQDQLCALDDFSCLDGCMQLAAVQAHCVCNSGSLFDPDPLVSFNAQVRRVRQSSLDNRAMLLYFFCTE